MFNRRYHVTLEPSAESAREARRFFTRVARRCHVPPDEVPLGVLAVSELVTNAVVHAPGPIRVRARPVGRGIRVEVSDCSVSTPRMGRPAADRVGSRGLPIVAAVAGEWGWDSEPDEAGKRVWFTLPVDRAAVPERHRPTRH